MSIITFTQQQMCEALRVSRPTITKYARLGMPVISRGRYDLGACIAWYVEHQKSLAGIEKGGTRKAATDPETRLLEARALKIEMENAEKQHDLIQYQDVAALILWYTTIVSNGFESMGARLGTILAAMDEPAEIQHEIWKEGRQIREMLSRKIEKLDLTKILPDDNTTTPAE